jgi:hypothetical protein
MNEDTSRDCSGGVFSCPCGRPTRSLVGTGKPAMPVGKAAGSATCASRTHTSEPHVTGALPVKLPSQMPLCFAACHPYRLTRGMRPSGVTCMQAPGILPACPFGQRGRVASLVPPSGSRRSELRRLRPTQAKAGMIVPGDGENNRVGVMMVL